MIMIISRKKSSPRPELFHYQKRRKTPGFSPGDISRGVSGMRHLCLGLCSIQHYAA